jgi:predicted GH43/DUF377 family glycosyl hydrolase
MRSSEGLFVRDPHNPILTRDDWPYCVNAVMNAGATTLRDETALVCRVEDRRGISHLALARSADGVTDWRIGAAPMLEPAEDRPEEVWGLEDARVTRVDELGCWVIVYTAFAPGGPGISFATTKDFESFERLGVVMAPENKNGALFPRTIDGEFVLFHRPVSTFGGGSGVWISRSPDMISWTPPELTLPAREGAWWDSARLGAGAPPLETDAGWLVIYHGVRNTVAGALYRMGAALLDLDHPTTVLHRTPEWLLGPTALYERTGDVPGVVFPCGLVHDVEHDRLRVYYGAADTSIAVASASLSDLIAYLGDCPPI